MEQKKEKNALVLKDGMDGMIHKSLLCYECLLTLSTTTSKRDQEKEAIVKKQRKGRRQKKSRHRERRVKKEKEEEGRRMNKKKGNNTMNVDAVVQRENVVVAGWEAMIGEVEVAEVMLSNTIINLQVNGNEVSAVTSSREDDMETCLCCSFAQDVKPISLDLSDEYQP
ncbi:unnamed protein product [Lupinus luteus]|uniref:Uncharacterized protein n=1 Tax=Lupinus luteus TaxID=3873 RepID=A0AAV1WFQ1_LUPLU